MAWGGQAQAVGVDAAQRSSFPELDCVADLVPTAAIRAAQIRASRIGVSAERTLVADRVIDEESYLRALAASTGIGFETLSQTRRYECPLADERLIAAPAAGVLPLRNDGQSVFVVAPRDVRQFLSYIYANPQLIPYLRLTSAPRLKYFVLTQAGSALGKRASGLLAQMLPEMSAAPDVWPVTGRKISMVALVLVAAMSFAPEPTILFFELLLTGVFLGWIVLRLVGMFMRPPRQPKPRPIPESELPIYSIVVALYREAASVRRLVQALEALDYPREKLDIKLVLEQDDRETLTALSQIDLGPEFDIIIAPDVGPRTKPKALNVALPMTRGTFVVVYDAEDRPEPDQLRHALAAFRSGRRNLACVQAKLTIDNTADSWLAGIYTAEYAAQFDVFLPALAALSAPLPLGGTSNHFRAGVLREVGAWDSYNVTEDADLGLRLSRLGYCCDVINSATYEEAPARFAPWLRQRTRWFKGWMKTWLVHMRRPGKLLGDVGPFSFVIFQLAFGGNVLAALVHPFFLIALARTIFTDASFLPGDDGAFAVLAGLFGTTAAIGYLTSGILSSVGLIRRGLFRTLWVVLLTPLHWVLLSLAAWRALYQLFRDPYLWEKTEHGLARTSRRRTVMAQALAQLESQMRGARAA
jgi:cellulose synthase/poly-beta-1,6-N-acetylglucosamine synthase-like glycosyltransferase